MTGPQLGKLRETPGLVQIGWGTMDGGNIYKCMTEKILRHVTESLEYLERKWETYKENQANELNGVIPEERNYMEKEY